MEFSKAIPIGEKTNISLPSNIESLPCGLFRCGLKDAFIKLPELSCLYKTSPVEISNDWQIDIKIHMLMRGQYPCIPNWHCDNVIRDKDGALDFKKTSLEQSPYKMYIWLSNNPTTLFLREKLKLNFTPSSHRDIAKFLAHDDGNPAYPIESQQWYEFDQLTPHCGRAATENTWRVFARITHKSILPIRPKISEIRRHCQVYLDANNFTW